MMRGHHDESIRLALVGTTESQSCASIHPKIRWFIRASFALTLALGLASLWFARTSLIVATCVVAAAFLAALTNYVRKTRRFSKPHASLTMSRSCIALERQGAPSEEVFSFLPQFGFVLLATADRSVWVVALTNRWQTFCVGSIVGPSDKWRFRKLISRAVTTCRSELTRAVQSSKSISMHVEAQSLIRLIEWAKTLDAASLGRILLTDGLGNDVVLEQDQVLTSRGIFRLDQPLDWRGLVFHQGNDSLAVEYQGTWVRQGRSEMVLVSLRGDDVRQSIHDVAAVSSFRADGALKQDARLAASAASDPPAIEQRVAVDRLFMLPFRRALDTAPSEIPKSIPEVFRGDATRPDER
ncbi:MAG TPA: hypothetical protein PKL73_01580 [Polyangiaceae bacterium]|jgi:hypothetical protein|nr:MAG: hypothetical protein BWY17_01161 [Deltaproteobacteria bacterium ADurb.Bin207]HNS95610.1 hypothetical protein [Polyangiaceae bacterium]HNZ21236.1 hypothetical protein [Polyangiaceae bacterium]HOD21078.1 hypothetical protein [Polyangiaceae bacterium]HOE48018.1 hypothetical protein [Polyangiaceae bacterium]